MADDYSDNKTTSGVLTPGSVATGRIDGTFDTDWFRFDARAGGHYRFSAIQPSSSDAHGATIAPWLYVYDANGQMLPIYENGVLEPAADATYYVSVSYGGTQGSYAIRATELSDDYGATAQTASTISIGGRQGGSIDYAGDVDRFKISLTADNYYTFKLSGSSQANTEAMSLNITSAAGEWLGSMNPVYTPTGLRLTIRPTISGDVYVDAVHRGSNGTLPLAYTLTASHPFKDEYGNTPATSTNASLDIPISGTLQNPADVDMFKVMMVAGRTYSVSWNSAAPATWSERISVNVADDSGRSIGGASYTELTYKTVTPTVSGYHYVSLQGLEGDYSMTIAEAPDDYTANTSTTGRLILGKDTAGKLEQGGSDRDWFAVRMIAGTTYHLSADSTTWGYGLLRLLDSSGKELLQTTKGSSSTLVETAAFVPTRSGTYYVEISSPIAESWSYTVNARIGERDDHGGTNATATAMVTGQPITGKLEVPRDVDTFKFNVEAGKTYGLLPTMIDKPNVSLDLSISSSAAGSTNYWYVTGASGARVYSAETSGEVHVSVSGNGAGQYKLSAIDFGADDFGVSASSAGVLEASGSIQASLSNPVDRDAFRVTLQAGKSYAFELLGSLSGKGTMDVANHQFSVSSTNNTPIHEVWLRSSVEPRIMVTPSASGDYLINVGTYNGQMGSYTVRSLMLGGDVTGPTLLAQSHAQNAVNVPLTSSKIELVFDEAISIDKTAIVLKDASGQTITPSWSANPSSPWVSGNKVVFDVGAYLNPGTYTLSIPQQAVFDLAGNPHQGPETLTFSTVMPSTVATSGADLLAPVRGGTTAGGAGTDTVIYGADVYIQNVDRTGNTTTLSYFQNGVFTTDTLVDVERVLFGRNAHALDIDGTGGQAYRLYRAAFDRSPDLDGLGFWMTQMDKGMPLTKVANLFLTSPESVRLYGENTTDTQFVTQLYRNVLDREPEAAGLQSWLNVLANGMSRAEVLTGFSESPENIAAVATIIGEGFSYTLIG